MRTPHLDSTARFSSVRLIALALGLSTFAPHGWGAAWPIVGPPRTHDPSIVKENGTWWLFETGRGLPVKRSADGLTWTQATPLLATEKPWWRNFAPAMTRDDIWAPDVHWFRDRYWCYYSVSEFGKNNSAIGLLSCRDIAAGDWRDDGLVIGSKAGAEVYNAIDPNLTVDARGEPWLTFGSWFDGIQLVRLDAATMKPAGVPQRIAFHSGGIEAPNIVTANGYYYLFVSLDRCCIGLKSTYKIACGRAKEITGPYLARDGKPLLDGAATVLDAGDARWIGPGGQSVYFDGARWLVVHHAYDASDHGVPKLRIRDLYWDAEHWPTFETP